MKNEGRIAELLSEMLVKLDRLDDVVVEQREMKEKLDDVIVEQREMRIELIKQRELLQKRIASSTALQNNAIADLQKRVGALEAYSMRRGFLRKRRAIKNDFVSRPHTSTLFI